MRLLSMTENVRKYLSISFAVLTCIALILSLKISLVYIRAEELPGVAAYFENGFSFLNRNNLTIAHYLFDNLGVLAFKLICLLCVVFGAIGGVLSLSGLLCSAKNAKRLCTFAVSVAMFFSFFYSLLGIVYTQVIEAKISEEVLSNMIFHELFGIKVSTYSYFSFVAVLVAGVLYFVTAPNFATAPKTDKVAKSSQSQILEEKELKTVEVLLRYKELFDKGVINEQEYENKKRALLGESKEKS